MLITNRIPINANNDDCYESVVGRQEKVDKNFDTHKNYNTIPVRSTVAVW